MTYKCTIAKKMFLKNNKTDMNKATVIIGRIASGKSQISKALVSSLKGKEKIFLHEAHLKSVFGFAECTTDTKVIIIDELRKIEYLFTLIFATVDGVIVEKKGQEPFCIYPKIIIVCNEQITRQRLEDLGGSIQKRIK